MPTRKIFVQAPKVEKSLLVEIEDEAKVSDLLVRARDMGFDIPADAIVILEDTEEALELDAALEAVGVSNKATVQVGRCRRIALTVRYEKETHARDFSPAQRLRHVFNWALSKQAFDIPKGDAQDLGLQLPGGQGALDLDDHVGSLASGDLCELSLDLVPSDRIQGAP